MGESCSTYYCTPSPIFSVQDGPGLMPDFGQMSRVMTTLMEEHIVDPDLRDWIIPDFSTTTVTDTTVASIAMMATMKEYFSYTSGKSRKNLSSLADFTTLINLFQ
jgi:hypothetical protein